LKQPEAYVVTIPADILSLDELVDIKVAMWKRWQEAWMK
jgi:hypothetical protein